MKKINKLCKLYKRLRKNFRFYFKRNRQSVISMALIILICFLAIGASSVRAGSLTPSGAPAASGYTLGDIYVRLSSNAAATAGNHDLATTTSPSGTFYTLTQIYNSIPTIDPLTVKLGTSYLGVAGSLIPSGGTATTSDVLLGKTYFGADQADWNLATGAYNASNLAVGTVKSGTAFGVSLTGDYPSVAYPLTGDTGATDATTAEICNTNEAWTKAGVMIAGTLNPTASTIISGTTICGVPGTANPNPAFGDNSAAKVLTTAGTGPGTYDATNLTPENVRKNITFGVGQTGTFEVGYGYGSDTASGVLTTAAGTPGTFNVVNLDNSLIKSGTTWGVSLGSTGTLLPNGGTAIAADLFNSKTANLTADWDLDPGTLNLACNTATFNGTGNLAADGYDGLGNGSNRWCMATSTNSAVAGDIALYKSAWVNGVEISGSFASSTKTATLEGVDVTPDAGSWLSKVTVAITNLIDSVIKSGETVGGVVGSLLPSGGTATTSDVCVSKTYFGDSQTDWNLKTGALSPTAAYISTGNSYCGIAGTLLANLFSGTRTDGGFPGGSQANGGVDDYNNGDPAAGDRYSKGWTQCVEANDYCGTDTNDDGDNDSGADAKDDSTGLIWSLPCNGAGCDSFSDASPATYTWTASSSIPYDRSFSTVQGGIVDASVLCSGGDHQIAGWSLPHQKQLMQAYIDGSYGGNLESSGTTRLYWSATTQSYGTASAWHTNLSHGYTNGNNKTTGTSSLRCVRSAN
ncbi:MAG: hypothetical protein V1667_03290 [bacterium]